MANGEDGETEKKRRGIQKGLRRHIIINYASDFLEAPFLLREITAVSETLLRGTRRVAARLLLLRFLEDEERCAATATHPTSSTAHQDYREHTTQQNITVSSVSARTSNIISEFHQILFIIIIPGNVPSRGPPLPPVPWRPLL